MLPNRDNYIEGKFPDLFKTGYTITSPQDQTYNCIAWTASDNTHWWEPDFFFQHYWPTTAPRNYSPQAYVLAYETVGYKICDDSSFEEGYEKIAIYVDKKTNQVPHATRQLNNTTWTSKLGKNYDISHALEGLNGDTYARPEIFMKRVKPKI